ncbi:MAG TPA: hypothetical protein VGQ72_04485 [Pyrinomonadaceae bacterium]|nr:hypothetical protein [Pyrinomonadaceae bacterium]
MKLMRRLLAQQACGPGRLLAAVVICHFIFPHTVRAQPKPQLQLSAEILEQSYCSINATTSLQLKLRLRYTNLTADRLIVYSGHDLFYQTKIRSEPVAGTQPYEILLINMRYFDEELERIDAGSPGRVFVKLAPQESFERELITGIGVADKPEARTSTSVTPGRHTLQLIVSTWYQSPKLAEKLKQQWQRQGVLWFQPVVSAPVSVAIEKPATVSPCR